MTPRLSAVVPTRNRPDGCRVSTDWLQQICSLFEREPEAGLVFGKVSISEELKGRGFADDFEPHQRAYYHELAGDRART